MKFGKNGLAWSLALVAGISGFMLFSACAKPPIREVQSAEAALEKARQVEAPTYAPETFKSAEQMLSQAKNEMQGKKYKPAKKSALNARLLADRAYNEALKNKPGSETAPAQPGLTAEEMAAGPTIFPEQITVADLEKQKIGTGSLDEGMRISALEPIHFEFDEFNLSDAAREILTRNAEWLKKYVNVLIQIEGHCDERGSNEYNLALGEKRAKVARDFIIYLGIDPSRLSIISYGEEIPVDPGNDEAAWAKNRRCEFVVKNQ